MPGGGDDELRPGTRLIRDLAYPAAFTVRIDGTDQSYVDLDDPLRLEFDYVQRIADLIDVLTEPGRPVRVVHVGGGALTLPRYVAASRPRSAQIVFEPDAELTTFVRQHLPLPKRSGIRVRHGDGRTGMATLPDGRADLIIIDAFVGAQVPAELTTVEFMTDAQRALAPQVRSSSTSPIGVRQPTAGASWPVCVRSSSTRCWLPSRPPSKDAGSETSW